jgi:hypothetical protein
MVQYAPSLWGGIYSMLENPFVEKQLGGFTRLQAMLEKILNETQPDCVVSTYPVYGHVIKKIFAGHERPVQVHHRRHRFHHHQFLVVPRAERLLLRGQRRHRRCLDQGRRRGETNQDARLSGESHFRRQPGRRFPSPPATNRAASFTSSTPARKRPARPLTACSNSKTSISPSPPGATRTARQAHRAHPRLRRPREGARLDEPDARTDDEPPPRHQQGRRRDRAGSHRRALPDDCQPGHPRPGGRQRRTHLALQPRRRRGEKQGSGRGSTRPLPNARRSGTNGARTSRKSPGPTPPCASANSSSPSRRPRWPGRKAVKLFETAPDRVMRPAAGSGQRNRQCADAAVRFPHPHQLFRRQTLRAGVVDFYGERGFDCICITDHLADPSGCSAN